LRKLILVTVFVITASAVYIPSYAFGVSDSLSQVSDTLLTHKEARKEKKHERKQERKDKIGAHVLLSLNFTYAFLESQIRFITPSGLLSFQVGLEKNLGLQDQAMIYSSSIIARITPRSGIYGMYYGLNRSSKYVMKNDIILPKDTIHAGSFVEAYFNTYVFSLGYMFSILKEQKSFLGIYFNIYVMNIQTGVASNILKESSYSYQFLAPLPNFGLIMDFELAKWFRITGGMGLFFVNNIEGVGGTIHDINFYTIFKPAKWVALSIGAQAFNVIVTSDETDYLLNISYSFKGPSCSLKFIF
jgi:hypothetical protein